MSHTSMDRLTLLDTRCRKWRAAESRPVEPKALCRINGISSHPDIELGAPCLVETWGADIIASRHVFSLVFEQVRRVGDRRARAHRGRDYRCFRQHRVICAGLTGCSYMQLNAV